MVQLDNAPRYFFGTQRGGTTLDEGKGGGNPFASSLVELLERERLTLAALRTGLTNLTIGKSGGWQHPEISSLGKLARWRVLPPRANETRVALVMVFSDYSSSGGLASLHGAEHDAGRVAKSLIGAGFSTTAVVDPTRQTLQTQLAKFRTRTRKSDAAMLYCTGHGLEVDGAVYLLPGDYPIARRSHALATHGVRLGRLASAVEATRVNLVFYAGCRDSRLG